MTAFHLPLAWGHAPASRRVVGLGAALLVQLLCVAWLQQAWRAPPRSVKPAREAVVLAQVRLLPGPSGAPRTEAPGRTARAAQAPSPATLRMEAAPTPAGRAPALPQPDPGKTWPPARDTVTDTQPPSATWLAATSPSGTGTAAPANARAQAPLNLSLPARPASGNERAALMRQVIEDPRLGREVRGVEWAVADAAGTLPVTVQSSTSGSGSKLIRQGSKCYRAYENRMKDLHPMDERTRSLPDMVGKCFSKD